MQTTPMRATAASSSRRRARRNPQFRSPHATRDREGAYTRADHYVWIAVAKVSVVAQPHEHCLAFLGDDVYHLTALLQRIFTAQLLAMIFFSFDLLFELKLRSRPGIRNEFCLQHLTVF